MGKSGALITAHFALEQGRDVFAVPGSIFSSTSRETNRLTKMGAKLVDVIEAIVEELAPTAKSLLAGSKKNSVPENLSQNEKCVYSLLLFEEIHIDSLIENSRLLPEEVSATLMQLELCGLVRQMEGKMVVSTTG